MVCGSRLQYDPQWHVNLINSKRCKPHQRKVEIQQMCDNLPLWFYHETSYGKIPGFFNIGVMLILFPSVMNFAAFPTMIGQNLYCEKPHRNLYVRQPVYWAAIFTRHSGWGLVVFKMKENKNVLFSIESYMYCNWKVMLSGKEIAYLFGNGWNKAKIELQAFNLPNRMQMLVSDSGSPVKVLTKSDKWNNNHMRLSHVPSKPSFGFKWGWNYCSVHTRFQL